MKRYTHTEIKELNSFAIDGDSNANICTLSLYNWNDEAEIATDAVSIELTQTDIRAMIECLESYVKSEVV